MTTRTMVFQAKIDGKTFRTQLKRLKDDGGKAFGGATQGAKGLGLQMGVTAGIVGALTEKIIELGARATAELKGIAERGVEMNKTFEQAERVFGNVFNDPNLGKQTVQFLRDTADALKIAQDEAIGFGQRILPRTSDLETFQKLLELTAVQASATGTTVDDLEFSIREALSGDFVSIRDRFDLSRETVERIKELGQEIGLDKALAQELGREFERLGKVRLTDTLDADLKTIRSEFSNLQAVLGSPIFEQLKETLGDVLSAFENNKGDITEAALALGDMAAAAVDLVGSGIIDFIEDVDTDGVQEFADRFIDVFNTAGLLLDLIDAPNAFNSLIDGATTLLEKLGEAGRTAARIAAISRAQRAQVLAENKALEDNLESFVGEVNTDGPLVNQTALRAVGRLFADEELKVRAAAEGQKAYEQSLRESLEAFEEFDEAQAKSAETTETRSERAKQQVEVDEDAINAALERKAAEEELTKTLDEAASAEERVEEATEKANKAREDADLDLQIKQERRLTKELLDNARAREKIAQANAEAVADINRKNLESVEDEIKDLSREEQKIARDGARQQTKIATDEANQKLSIERDFRQRLDGIRRSFEQSATEAAINVDAQAFARAKRTRDNQITDAEATRDNQLEETRITAQQQREELKVQLRAEVEDARIANRQKLEDLQMRLARELEEQRIANQRDLEEQARVEAQKAEDRLTRNAQEIADLETQFQRKQEALQDSLKAEFAAIAAAEEAKTAKVAAEEAERTRIVEENARRRAAANAARQRVNQSGQSTVGGGIPVLHQGGAIGAGQTALVQTGEGFLPDERLFTPSVSGTVIPRSDMFSPIGGLGAGGVNRSVTNNNTLNAGLTPNMINDPEVMAIFEKMAERAMQRVFLR